MPHTLQDLAGLWTRDQQQISQEDGGRLSCRQIRWWILHPLAQAQLLHAPGQGQHVGWAGHAAACAAAGAGLQVGQGALVVEQERGHDVNARSRRDGMPGAVKRRNKALNNNGVREQGNEKTAV